MVMMRCKVCHKQADLTVNNATIYESDIVRENYVCVGCSTVAKRIKIKVKCNKCGTDFATRVFIENKDKYSDKWLCPVCATNGQKISAIKPKRGSFDNSCVYCQHQRGVCCHPDNNCSLIAGFVPFHSSQLYSIKKTCTIMSIDRVRKDRDDVHTFRYALLHDEKYLISTSNLILIKCRKGTNSGYTNNVVVFRYDAKKSAFGIVFNNKFEKGVDWVKPVKQFMMETVPNLVE